VSTAYPTRPDPVINHNLDSMKYRYIISAPKPFDGQFRSHVDLVSATPPLSDDSWVTLSQSGTTTKLMAVTGSEFQYAPTPGGDPVKCAVHAGALCLVNPGPSKNQWTISVPRNDTGVCIKSSGGDPLDTTHGKKFDLDPFTGEFAPDEDEDHA
jgi:hypothetical protein